MTFCKGTTKKSKQKSLDIWNPDLIVSEKCGKDNPIN